jgi:hypothetical protein
VALQFSRQRCNASACTALTSSPFCSLLLWLGLKRMQKTRSLELLMVTSGLCCSPSFFTGLMSFQFHTATVRLSSLPMVIRYLPSGEKARPMTPRSWNTMRCTSAMVLRSQMHVKGCPNAQHPLSERSACPHTASTRASYRRAALGVELASGHQRLRGVDSQAARQGDVWGRWRRSGAPENVLRVLEEVALRLGGGVHHHARSGNAARETTA